MTKPDYQSCWYCAHSSYAHASSSVVRCVHPVYPMNRTKPEGDRRSWEMVPGIAPDD